MSVVRCRLSVVTKMERYGSRQLLKDITLFSNLLLKIRCRLSVVFIFSENKQLITKLVQKSDKLLKLLNLIINSMRKCHLGVTC